MYLVSKICSFGHSAEQSNLHYASQKLNLRQDLRQLVNNSNMSSMGKAHFGWILHLLLPKWGIDHKVAIVGDYGARYGHVDS